jgi:hypothetical protein
VALRIDLLDAFLRHADRDELADGAVGEVPADRAAALGEMLDGTGVGDRVELMSVEVARQCHAVKAGLVKLLDERLGHALLALDLVLVGAQLGLDRLGRLHDRVRLDIERQSRRFDHSVHHTVPPARLRRPLPAILGQDRRISLT